MRDITLLLFLLIFAIHASGQETKKFSIKARGLIFGDIYHVQSSHLEDAVGETGAVMRRLYATLDFKYGEKWFSRFRIEANQAGEYNDYSVDFQFKDVFIGYKFEKHKIILGLSPTKTFNLVERLWGLRYLARTPMDLQGNPSRDLGISIDGTISEKKGFDYRFMLGDGAEFGAKDGDGLKVQGGISWAFSEKWLFDVYADYEVLEGNTDRSTIQFFVAYTDERFRTGLLYAYQDRQSDPILEIFSVYTVGKVYKNISFIGRVDRLMEPSPRGDDIDYIPFDPSAKATFVIGGFEFPLCEYFTVVPNVIYTNYDKNAQGISPRYDLSYRLTLYLKAR